MNSLATDLKVEFDKNSRKLPGFLKKGIINAIEKNGRELTPLQVGDKLEGGILLNHRNEQIDLSQIIGNNATIISFYRGSWCPYCNLELRHYDRLIGASKEKINMIAISPERPDITATELDVEKLNFSVLSDIDNMYAKELGLLYRVSDKVKLLFRAKGVNLEKSQGNTKGELPLAATYVIDKDRVIKKVWFDTNFTKRAEPTEVIDAYHKVNAELE